MSYEPYANVELETIFCPPLLGELPEEYENTKAPEGFSLLNFKVCIIYRFIIIGDK